MKTPRNQFENLNDSLFEKVDKHHANSIRAGLDETLQQPASCTQDNVCNQPKPTLVVPSACSNPK